MDLLTLFKRFTRLERWILFKLWKRTVWINPCQNFPQKHCFWDTQELLLFEFLELPSRFPFRIFFLIGKNGWKFSWRSSLSSFRKWKRKRSIEGWFSSNSKISKISRQSYLGRENKIFFWLDKIWIQHESKIDKNKLLPIVFHGFFLRIWKMKIKQCY